MKEFLLNLKDCLIKNKKAVIATHVNPDGDAIGSAFAMALIIKKIGVEPFVVIDDYNDKFNFIKGTEFIYKGDILDISDKVLICVDCGDKNRIGCVGDLFERTENVFNIDHHISNTNFGNFNLVYPNASSTCEIVFDIAEFFNVSDKYIAEALYTGIITDTCGFKHKSTTEKTHITAGKLINFGIDFSEIQTNMLYSHSLTEVSVFLKALENMKIKSFISYTTLSEKEMKDCNASSKDVDGIVEYILNINNIKMSFFIYEKDNGNMKISFRSKEIDVNKLASMLGGGGHVLAAGAEYKGSMEQALNKVFELLEKELDFNG